MHLFTKPPAIASGFELRTESPVGWVDAVPTQHLRTPDLLGCEKDATQPTHTSFCRIFSHKS